MQLTMHRKPVEKLLPSDKAEKELLNASLFEPPKFDTDLQNYFYYTEVYKDWFQLK
ncbi:MAG: hypothetical protein ACJ71K_20980 [Nitrososphaeraceae archaeon]|jgi:hypothetical protein